MIILYYNEELFDLIPMYFFATVASLAENLVSSDHEDVTSTTWTEFDCRSKSDGSYGGGCRAFYRCISGLTYFVSCKGQYVYNKNSGKCTK